VITGAPFPSVDVAHGRVLHFQRKLHEWASNDAERRFCDLWNLVCDPATLVVAWSPRPTGAGMKRTHSVCSWRAGCGGTRKSGSEGGGEEITGRKAGIGASPPTLRDAAAGVDASICRETALWDVPAFGNVT
jgi:hypothetical protein